MTSRNGPAFLVVSIAAVVCLINGLAMSAWFTSTAGGDSGFEITTAVRLGSIEVCLGAICNSTLAYTMVGSSYGMLGFLTVVGGVAFGALVVWGAFRRITMYEIPRWQRLVGYALGGLLLVTSVCCMFVTKPISPVYGTLVGPSTLHLDIGGFVTLAGLVLGVVMFYGGRPEDIPVGRDYSELDARPKPPRREIVPPPRGIETDPFRAPPEPPPVAVVRNDRPTTAPVVLDPDDESPKLLR